MVRNNRTQGGKSSKNVITNVRITDENAGVDGLYVDRCISQLNSTAGLVTLLVGSTVSTQGGSTAASFNVSSATVVGSDEFTSMAMQFELFRVRAAKFDVYDLTPTVVTPVAVGTWHDEVTTPQTWTFDQVTDSPDSQIVSVGVGKATFYWRAHGTTELGWQSTASSGAPALVNYGGLRIAYPASSTGKTYQVMAKFVVDFRGRY